MTRRQRARTQPCDERDAGTRLAHAQNFYEVAELVSSEQNIPESASVAAALAVLAGIAASDSACCKVLGRRHRGQDHRDARQLLEQITPGGDMAAKALTRLLDLKDAAHYGLFDVGGQDQRSALRQSQTLIEFAAEVQRR